MNKLKSLAILSTMMALNGNSPYSEQNKIKPKQKKQLTEDEIAERKGLTKFFYGDNNYIWALNKKNADGYHTMQMHSFMDDFECVGLRLAGTEAQLILGLCLFH